MVTSAAIRLGSVDVKGGLWGADLLAALADDRARLPTDTIAPTSYGLPARASTEQAARAAWTVLTAAWDEFTEQHTAKVERDGTDDYGDDRFTYDSWTRHLLTQLGYTPTETPPGGLAVDDERDLDQDGQPDRFPITHQHADQVPLHLLAAGVPLDRRTRGVVGAHAQSPHSVVQDYLNRTATHLWAIVTNGLTLRILRDNAALSRQAYIEFDLAAIFDDGAYADFALLWHAAHATRFTHGPDTGPADCIAETWQEHATATGVAALDDLRDGVEAAIAEIGQGLVEHPANRPLRAALADPDDPFDAAALYRELLYVAYRHVFWFTLDDRDLLHPPDADRTKVALYRDHYASTVLRAKARAHLGGHHPDGWRHFTTVASWVANPEGQPALALPGLLGRLWDPAATPHLNDATLTNRRYYEAVRRLAYVTRDGALQRINYDAMGSEELGAVYESLLEVRPSVDTDTRTFRLGRTDGSDRKKTGSYYTPTPLIKVLLDEALDPVLDQRLKQAVDNLPPDATPEIRQQAQEQTLLATTICDPAMGSAHFLVGAGMRAAKRLAQIRTEEIEPSPEAIQHAFRDVASRCLFGVDVNPMAVELAKVAIWLECHVPGQPLTFLDHHLKCGNALLGVGFDPELIAWHQTAKKAADQKGVPDAAFKALAGDDKAHAKLLRAKNKTRRGRGTQLRFESIGTHSDDLDRLAAETRQLTHLDDTTPEGLAAKQQAHATYLQDAELARQKLRADAWIASWIITKHSDITRPLIADDSALGDDQLPWDIYYDTFFDDGLDLDRPGVRAVREEASRFAFFHWHLEFPDIASAGGFSCMLGNPPFLNQLESATTQSRQIANLQQFRFGKAAAGYADVASLFLLQVQSFTAESGYFSLVQPDSFLSARDTGLARSALSYESTLRCIWVAGEKIFTASVLVVAPVMEKRGPRVCTLRRLLGSETKPFEPVEIDMDNLAAATSWSPLVSDLMGIPTVELTTKGQLSDLASATADFRDQFYGLAPFVQDYPTEGHPTFEFAPLVTTGLIDPLRSLWSVRATKFNKVNYQAPIVNLDLLRAESELGGWASMRLVPKVLLATQGKVLEAFVDAEGAVLPSVPVISVTASGDSETWLVAAMLLSPPVTAWAATQVMGSGLSVTSIKLSAKQVRGLPTPHGGQDWERAAAILRETATTESEAEWRDGLRRSAQLMCIAYSATDQSVLDWWLSRLPSWK